MSISSIVCAHHTPPVIWAKQCSTLTVTPPPLHSVLAQGNTQPKSRQVSGPFGLVYKHFVSVLQMATICHFRQQTISLNRTIEACAGFEWKLTNNSSLNVSPLNVSPLNKVSELQKCSEIFKSSCTFHSDVQDFVSHKNHQKFWTALQLGDFQANFESPLVCRIAKEPPTGNRRKVAL